MPKPSNSLNDLLDRGHRHMEAGDLSAAKTCFEQACKLDPASTSALFGLGTVYYRLEDDEHAASALHNAARLSPEMPEIWNNLGAALGRAGKTEQAITAFRRVCHMQPDHAPAAMNLGRLLLNEGQAEEGEQWLSQSVKTRPKHGVTLRLLAEARLAMGQPRAAAQAAKIAVAVDPDNIEAHFALGQAYVSIRKLDAARHELRLVLGHNPDHPQATYYLAEIEEKSGRIDEARVLFDRVLALEIDPSFRTLLKLRRALALPIISEDRASIEIDRARITQALDDLPRDPVDDPCMSGGFTNFYLAYQGENDRELQERIAQFYLDVSPELAFTAPHVHSPRKRGRFKVAVLSSFLRSHTVGYLARGLIEHLDRERFDVILLRSPSIPVADPVASDIAALADEVIDLPDNLPAAQAVVADVEADLIYFPEIGMENLVYFLAFARSAPVQVMGWGHPVTTGIPNVDVFLSVDTMEPDDAATHYSERLIALDGLSLCVQAPVLPTDRIDKARFGMDANAPAYLCAQSLYKIHPDFDPVIADLLEQDPNARIYFLTIHTQSDDIFLSRLERVVGVHMDRVAILPRVKSKDFPLLLKTADVLLDVPQWSGGKTSLEGLAAGTPIVHWPGTFMRGRHTLAFYKCMGVMECVVDSATAYVETAIRLAHDVPFRASVRARIAETSAALFNEASAIDEISDVFETLIRETR
jgi:protein O-GlcNAc transferase